MTRVPRVEDLPTAACLASTKPGRMRIRIKKAALTLTLLALCGVAQANDGPLGIDSVVKFDDSGIWKRSNQRAVLGIIVGGEILGALWEGSETRLGRTCFQAIDATIVGSVSAEALKRVFRRARPRETDNPDTWFTHAGRSFPSGEVTLGAAIVTPFVLEYGDDYPAVYALELIPLYQAQARMKNHAHWQTDVLAAWALGTFVGRYAHRRKESFTVAILPSGITVGWKGKF